MQEKFHQYDLRTELAKKHSHATYLASPTDEPEHQVVLTVFSASLFHFPHERENLLQKAQRIKQLQHPHLLPVLEMGIEEEQPFVVREYLPSGSLRSHLKQISPHRLELRDALTIVLQVGEALAYAYEQNILHGNVKPENILLDAHGQAMLTDFYLVSRKDAIIRDQISEEYAFCYMAPEQFAGISDARSDQYALGCLAYELITGHVPFAAQSLASMMGQPNPAPPAPLSESVADLPASLEVAILKTLAKDPLERFFDFSLFLDVIRSILSPPPAFPLLRSPNSHKHRIISRPMQSGKIETISSPIRKRAIKHVAPQPSEPSKAFSSAENNTVEPVVAPAIPSNIPGQTGTAPLTESLASVWQLHADPLSNRNDEDLDQPLKEQKHNASALSMLPLLDIFTDKQDITTLFRKQEADNLLFSEGEADELPMRITSSPYGLSKDIIHTITSSDTKSSIVHKQHSRQASRILSSKRRVIGLVLLILVIIASSAYAIFSPFSSIQPNLLRQPTQVLRQNGIIPLVPIQSSNTPNTQPSGKDIPYTANGQNSTIGIQTANTQPSTQDKSISTELSPSKITSQGSSSSTPPSGSSSLTPSSDSSSTPPSGSSSPPPSSSSSTPSSSSSSPPPSSSSSTPASSQGSTTTTNMTIYFGDWADNSPPGGSIAYPQIHQTAGGTGTYSDPITFAGSKNALSPGTIIYVSYLKKYFIMEDDCSDCDSAWNNNHTYEITLWIGGDANSSKSALQSCANSLTPNSAQPIQVQPPSNNAVDTTPLFTDSGGCIKL
jgi:serine/threonine protein kinase